MTNPVRATLSDTEASAKAQAAAGGDLAAFRSLYECFSGSVFATSYSVLGDWALAEDTAQEVWVKVHQNLDRFQAGTNLKAWLITIAHHAAIDAQRKNRRTVPIPEDVAARGPDLDHRRAFADMLRDLAPDERLIVTLKYREDLPYKDIARITGKAEGTLRNALSAALRKLRGTATAAGGAR